jgi:hypothetical protein
MLCFRVESGRMLGVGQGRMDKDEKAKSNGYITLNNSIQTMNVTDIILAGNAKV